MLKSSIIQHGIENTIMLQLKICGRMSYNLKAIESKHMKEKTCSSIPNKKITK